VFDRITSRSALSSIANNCRGDTVEAEGRQIAVADEIPKEQIADVVKSVSEPAQPAR
jgi:hypothetical protein